MKQITHTSLQSSYDCLYAVIRDVLSCFYLHPILCGLISLNTLYKNSCTFLLLLVVFLILHGNTSHLWCCQLFCSFTLPLLTTSLFLCTSLNFLCFLFGNNHFCLERPFLILAGIPVKYHQSHQLKCCHHACCKAAVVSSFMSTYFFLLPLFCKLCCLSFAVIFFILHWVFCCIDKYLVWRWICHLGPYCRPPLLPIFWCRPAPMHWYSHEPLCDLLITFPPSNFDLICIQHSARDLWLYCKKLWNFFNKPA